MGAEMMLLMRMKENGAHVRDGLKMLKLLDGCRATTI